MISDNERKFLENICKIDPNTGAIIQALLITNVNEEAIIQVIYEMDDMAVFKRWGDIKIIVEEGKPTRVLGQRRHIIGSVKENSLP